MLDFLAVCQGMPAPGGRGGGHRRLDTRPGGAAAAAGGGGRGNLALDARPGLSAAEAALQQAMDF